MEIISNTLRLVVYPVTRPSLQALELARSPNSLLSSCYPGMLRYFLIKNFKLFNWFVENQINLTASERVIFSGFLTRWVNSKGEHPIGNRTHVSHLDFGHFKRPYVACRLTGPDSTGFENIEVDDRRNPAYSRRQALGLEANVEQQLAPKSLREGNMAIKHAQLVLRENTKGFKSSLSANRLLNRRYFKPHVMTHIADQFVENTDLYNLLMNTELQLPSPPYRCLDISGSNQPP